jgi:hypothetical protein
MIEERHVGVDAECTDLHFLHNQHPNLCDLTSHLSCCTFMAFLNFLSLFPYGSQSQFENSHGMSTLCSLHSYLYSKAELKRNGDKKSHLVSGHSE